MCRFKINDQATGWAFRGSNSGTGNIYFSSPKYPDRLWGPSGFLFNGRRGSFPVIWRPACDAEHSLPSSADVKNEWSYTSTPPIYLHGVDRGPPSLIRKVEEQLFPEVNRPEHEANHSSPSSDKCKKWSYSFSFPINLRGVQKICGSRRKPEMKVRKDNFTCRLLLNPWTEKETTERHRRCRM